MTVTYGEQRTEQEVEVDAIVMARIKRGMAWLQEQYGDDWVERIDLSKFNIRDMRYCVLGQVMCADHGGLGYSAGAQQIRAELDEDDPVWELGFDLKSGVEHASLEWDRLQDGWRTVLEPLVTTTNQGGQ